ncbi:MAG: hypothetical protein H6870_04910 [Methylobacteriaceae bacterium]|nr:hypothetical protein [Methylobacteriaceae bacterium]
MTFRFQRVTALRFYFALSGATLLAAPALAQMQLPGAFTPAPAGTVVGPAKAAKPKKAGPRKPPPAKVPSDDTVIGRPLMQNGAFGVIEFARAGKDLQVIKLKLRGDLISRVGDRCEVDLSAEPIALTAADKPAGVTRYNLDLPACPFAVDIFNGAVKVVREGGACEFKAADCRVDPSGLWGQPANEIGPKRAKEIEKERNHAEHAMREQFKDWIRSAGKDRALVTRIAHEQAAFSSRREELCRSYQRETEHGYCALIYTEARSSAIAARILPPAPPEDERPAAKKKPSRGR